MKIAVTGGGGFIGSNVVDKLTKSGHEVLVVDNWLTGKPQNVAKEILGGQITIDILDYQMTTFAFQLFKPDLVVHCANQKGETSFQFNTLGLLNLLDAMKFSNCEKIVYISTAEVYGACNDFPSPEETKCRALTEFGQSKFNDESVIRYYRRKYRFQYNILRLGTAYGPNMNSGFLLDCIKAVFDGSPLNLKNGGSSTRDYVYVEDVTEAVNLAVTSLENKTFNLSYGEETKDGVVFEHIKNVTGVQKESIPVQDDDEVSRIYLNVSRISKCLNWQATTKLLDGITKTIKWYRDTSSQMVIDEDGV